MQISVRQALSGVSSPVTARVPLAGTTYTVGQTEREILAAIPYQPNEAVLHTDTGQLPAVGGAAA